MMSIESALVEEIAGEYATGLAELLGAGTARKSHGAYYTPPVLVECLLDSALQPLIDEALTAPTPAARINRLMTLTVCDPACGAGAFPVAAARRIARAVAAQWEAWRVSPDRGPLGEPRPSPDISRRAVRAVIAKLIHGVDLSETAAELCKIALWLEAFDPDLPNCYLDGKIRVGNALIGATPALLESGIPDDAYKALAGDDKAVVTEVRKRNRAERDRPIEGVLF
jgi:type I restriction-modification system DNA methylase subunit